ncbi:hypothetical protein CALCODRAFT_498223 [Calocera cornea HHB12733]|uniref:RBR-type E3 ubiquitin transferase n=1 Tax=Calocera cornea HHB12733 TaxID=1353952 RepID=A0A165EXX3_9BASI|nr:hypothetical protein CALCODRAFT_498223 [Calocera cornea HHB12733]
MDLPEPSEMLIERERELVQGGEGEPPRCSLCGYKYSCATCVLYSLAALWATGSPTASTATSIDDPLRRASSSSSTPGSGYTPLSLPSTTSEASAAAEASTSGGTSTTTTYAHQQHWLRWPLIPPNARTTAGLCVICDTAYHYPSHDAPRHVTSRCAHEGRACEDCVLRWLGYMVEDQRALRCPVVGCMEEMELDDVRFWAPQETFERYETLQLRRALARSPSFHWCLNPRCPSGQFHVPLPSPSPNSSPNPCDPALLTCHACGFQSCAVHQLPWHKGLTCEEWEKAHGGWWDPVRRRERGVRRWVGRKTRKCPGCGKDIEKQDGCDHMTCRQPVGCGAQFCWRCGADYTLIFSEGNSHHKRTCKHYRPRRRFRWKFWKGRGMNDF